MKRIMILVLVGMIFGFTAETSLQDKLRPPREETLIEVIKAPRIAQINPYQDEYEQMLYPTVRITAGYSTGTGVIIATTDSHRYTRIITAAHVVEDENTVNIELYDSTIITGTVVITDTVKDLALIKPEINTDKIYTAKLAPKTYQYFIFTPVYAIGCSLGLSPRPSSGILSALSASVVEITAPVLPGNSGGPVYAESQRSPDNFGDARTYEVIGIAVWVKVYDGQLVTTMAGVVPINEIHNFLDSATKTQSH